MSSDVERYEGRHPQTRAEALGAEFVIEGIDSSDHIFQTIDATHAFYESELLLATHKLIRPGDFIVDAGANIGNHSLFWGGACKAKVLAIEPSLLIFGVLRNNVALNHLEASVFVRRYGLGSESGAAATPVVDRANTGQTRLVLEAGGPVVVRPLDEVPEVARHRVRLIKIDVEGMEDQVLDGARATLAEHRPAVLVECLDDARLHAVQERLAPLEYAMADCFNVSPTYLFMPSGFDYPVNYTRVDHLSEITGRLARGAVLQRNQFNALNRRLK